MKKLFTLALTLFILNAAFSQVTVARVSIQTPNFGVSYSRSNNNGYYSNGYNNGGYYNNNYGDERSYRIAHVNDIYEQKVHEVMCMPVDPFRKGQLIYELKKIRAEKIRHINRTSYNNDYNNNYYNNDVLNW